jgi:hypothetical protein
VTRRIVSAPYAGSQETKYSSSALRLASSQLLNVSIRSTASGSSVSNSMPSVSHPRTCWTCTPRCSSSTQPFAPTAAQCRSIRLSLVARERRCSHRGVCRRAMRSSRHAVDARVLPCTDTSCLGTTRTGHLSHCGTPGRTLCSSSSSTTPADTSQALLLGPHSRFLLGAVRVAGGTRGAATHAGGPTRLQTQPHGAAGCSAVAEWLLVAAAWFASSAAGGCASVQAAVHHSCVQCSTEACSLQRTSATGEV